MPEITPVPLANIALAKGTATAGAGMFSAGVGQVPVADPNNAWLNGCHTVTSNASDAIYQRVHGTGGTGTVPTVVPWTESIQGFSFNGRVDNAHAQGFIDDVANYPIFFHSNEHYYQIQDTTEWYTEVTSIDRSVNFRPTYTVFGNTNYHVDTIWLLNSWNVFHRTGSTALLTLQMTDAHPNGGTVTIANDGTAQPLQIITGANNIYFTANPDQAFIAQSALAASNGVTRDGVSFLSQGYYWNGTASTAAQASLTLGFGSASTSGDYYANISAGLANMRFHNNGNLGLNLPNVSLATQKIVIDIGYLGVINAAQNATYRTIGLAGTAGSEYVNLDADKRGTYFSGVLGQGTAGLSNRGDADVSTTLYIGQAGVAHGVVNSDDGLFFNASAHGGGGDHSIHFGYGRTGTGGGSNLLTLGGGAIANGATFAGPVGFYGLDAIAQQTVTGSRGGNAALASLLTALANTGFIADGTTA